MDDFRHSYGPAALVTGASSGIGAAFAEELAARGLDLVLAARRTDRMEALATRLRVDHGIAVTVTACDLADPAAPAALVGATAALDIGLVVSNAGFGFKGAHEETDPAGMADMLMVNCQAPMLLAHGFLPRLKARGRGGLLMVSSVEGLIGCPYSAAYSASKAFVVALGEALWGEAAGTGIDVLTVCPGATESEAAAKQGIDISALANVMPARDVARLSLDALAEGPTFCPSPAYRASFEGLLAMPRREALAAMAQGMRPRG